MIATCPLHTTLVPRWIPHRPGSSHNFCLLERGEVCYPITHAIKERIFGRLPRSSRLTEGHDVLVSLQPGIGSDPFLAAPPPPLDSSNHLGRFLALWSVFSSSMRSATASRATLSLSSFQSDARRTATSPRNLYPCRTWRGANHGYSPHRSDPGLVCETVPWICPRVLP
ncbi:hypothetical protein P175DRAFT_0561123 [Aspergillus ochraceoroseus IBT 24754]|uniref:Uncharacterized protein n=1 Tax=Aspergillus ochraceoroseus IBT 24754 TaxID=1392256 RepID=A0A2T5LLB0_9EURO|nr:uncharacterized protein P175DRAFT_0561123 [Aspergillus ochraceoroseus IBT 24754]PTU17070.1 hypothetical protein P175DRAFT_0561123 [Aspergillus ochraceoroseus IBT 24754]